MKYAPAALNSPLLRLATYLCLLCFSPISKAAQSQDGIWNHSALLAKTSATPINNIELLADTDILSGYLSEAPDIENRNLGQAGIILQLPLNDGSFSSFEVFEGHIFSAASSKNISSIKTYKAFGIDQPELLAHLDIGPRGFHAMILGSGKPIFIDPNFSEFKESKILGKSNNKIPKQYRAFQIEKIANFQCNFDNHNQTNIMPSQKIQPNTVARQNGTHLRTYRLAVTTSDEYANAVSSDGTEQEKIDETFAAIATAINRINLVFNQDLAIQLDLVIDNNLIVLDSESNPFSNDADADISKVTTEINNAIGNANYDIGHLFTVNGGGLALFQSVCDSKDKGKGVTGVFASELYTDAFYIDYVAHEIGHQFGAHHTFNGTSGSCGGNRNNTTSFEPGSGSTIMAYAGICESENLQSYSDPYFHAGSIDEILSFVNNPSTGGSCADTSTIDDNPPTVDAGDNHTIPAKTPFKLTASGSDIDPITYTWEQMDTGASTSSQTQMKQDNGSRTLFRSFPGTSSPIRYFPSFDDVLDNTSTIGEALPTTTRTLKFRVTARSGLYGSATNNENPILIKSVNTGSAFSVIEPQENASFFESSNMTVVWDTASTQHAPIDCAEVDILFANDGGINYDSFTSLLNNTPNDGSQLVTLPASTSSNARILIQCSDNIFYNINKGDFHIIDTNASLLAITLDSQSQVEGDSAFKTFLFSVTRTGILNQNSSVDYQLSGFGAKPTNNEDFISEQVFNGTLDFANEESEKIIIIKTQGDSFLEEDEQFRIILSNPNNALVSTANAIATIINDDFEIIESTKKKTKKGSFIFFELSLLSLFLFLKNNKLSQFLLLLFLNFSLLSCSQIIEKPTQKSSATHPQNNAENTQELALSWVKNANAEDDANKALQKKEYAFLAHAPKGKIIIPGLSEQQEVLAIKQGYTIHEGMGDLILSDAHLALRQVYISYAMQYNQILAQHLFTKTK